MDFRAHLAVDSLRLRVTGCLLCADLYTRPPGQACNHVYNVGLECRCRETGVADWVKNS